MATLLIGLVIGIAIGVVVMSMLNAATYADMLEEIKEMLDKM